MSPTRQPSLNSVDLLTSSAHPSAGETRFLSKNVPRQVLVLDELTQVRVDVRGVDRHGLAGPVRSVERDRLEEPLEDRVQPPRADVLAARVHLVRDLGDAPDAA